MPRAHSVAIIGLGPKGLYCLERLLAEAHARPLRRPLHIHVFNNSATFGTSPIYDPAQPDYILVNISVGEIDLWTADGPPAVCGGGPNFLAWHQQRFHPVKPLTGEEYLPRAIVGEYLSDGFDRICSHLPDGVSLLCYHAEVVDIAPRESRYQLEFVRHDDVAEKIAVDKVLLTTGHSQLRPGVDERRYFDFAHRHTRTLFIPYVYPVELTMKEIPPGAMVAMKGIGLTFIDAILELTEGRGGSFYRTAQDTIAYKPSGKEPRSIVPFSRTGLPMAPKSADLPQVDRPLIFLDEAALAELRSQSLDRKLDLEKDLWPFLEAEMELYYYRAAMGDGTWRQELETCRNDAPKMHRLIDSFHRADPEAQRFDYRYVLDPAASRHFASGSSYASFVEHYMEEEIARARLGQAGSGIKSAIEIWYEFRKALGQFFQFGGLTPASHRQLIEYWFPRFKRVVFGPPIINIEKLLALCKAGLVDFSVARSPVISLEENDGCFKVCSEVSGECIAAEILVDARYPSVNIRQDASSLYRNLVRRGMVRDFVNSDPRHDSDSYSPGAIDMVSASCFVIDSNGRSNEDIAVTGIPTEGNLVGNLTMARDEFSAAWAAQVIEQLRCREQISVDPAAQPNAMK